MSPQVELYLLVVSVCSLLHNTFHFVPLLDFCGHLLCIAHVFRAGVMQQIIRSVNRRSCLAIYHRVIISGNNTLQLCL